PEGTSSNKNLPSSSVVTLSSSIDPPLSVSSISLTPSPASSTVFPEMENASESKVFTSTDGSGSTGSSITGTSSTGSSMTGYSYSGSTGSSMTGSSWTGSSYCSAGSCCSKLPSLLL